MGHLAACGLSLNEAVYGCGWPPWRIRLSLRSRGSAQPPQTPIPPPP